MGEYEKEKHMSMRRLAASVLGVLLAVGVLGACDDGDGDNGGTEPGADTTLQMLTTTTTP